MGSRDQAETVTPPIGVGLSSSLSWGAPGLRGVVERTLCNHAQYDEQTPAHRRLGLGLPESRSLFVSLPVKRIDSATPGRERIQCQHYQANAEDAVSCLS